MHYDFTSLIAEHESAEDYCKDSDELNSKIKIYQEQYEKIESFFAPQEMIGTNDMVSGGDYKRLEKAKRYIEWANLKGEATILLMQILEEIRILMLT